MATATGVKKDPILISNKVFQQIQEPTQMIEDLTGTIIYANKYSGIGEVPMPDEWREAFNSDFGETGKNILVQLNNKLLQMADGPWYVDSRDGVIYIHNKKFNEPPAAEYSYQSENGELLQVNFETQYITRTISGGSSAGIGYDKSYGANAFGMPDEPKVVIKGSYLDYFDPATGSYKPNSAINAYRNGTLSYNQLLLINSSVKDFRKTNQSAFTPSQWKEIESIKQRDIRRYHKQQQSEVSKRYWEGDPDAPTINVNGKKVKVDNNYTRVDKALQEALETSDLSSLQVNVQEFLISRYGSAEAAAQVFQSLESQVGLAGFDEQLKKQFGGSEYTFVPTRPLKDDGTPDGGVTIKAYQEYTAPRYLSHTNSSQYVIPGNNPLGGTPTGGTVQMFGKIPVKANTTGYLLLHHFFSRKNPGYSKGGAGGGYGGYGGGLNASLNHSKKITEKKLQAKAILVGRPNLKSSQIIVLNNVGKKWSGNWYIKSCIHKMEGSSGYTTEVNLVKHGTKGGQAAVSSSHKRGSSKNSGSGGSIGGNKNITVGGHINLTQDEVIAYNAASPSQRFNMVVNILAGKPAATLNSKGSMYTRNGVNVDITYYPPSPEDIKKYGRAAEQGITRSVKKKKK